MLAEENKNTGTSALEGEKRSSQRLAVRVAPSYVWQGLSIGKRGKRKEGRSEIRNQILSVTKFLLL